MWVYIIKSWLPNGIFNSNPASWSSFKKFSLAVIFFLNLLIQKEFAVCRSPSSHAVFVAYHFYITSASTLTGLGLCNPHPFLTAVFLLTSAIVLTLACWKQKGKQDGKKGQVLIL